jgi:hypothetical protein
MTYKNMNNKYYCVERQYFIRNHNKLEYSANVVNIRLNALIKTMVLKTNKVYNDDLRFVVHTLRREWGLEESQIQEISTGEVHIKLSNENL